MITERTEAARLSAHVQALPFHDEVYASQTFSKTQSGGASFRQFESGQINFSDIPGYSGEPSRGSVETTAEPATNIEEKSVPNIATSQKTGVLEGREANAAEGEVSANVPTSCERQDNADATANPQSSSEGGMPNSGSKGGEGLHPPGPGSGSIGGDLTKEGIFHPGPSHATEQAAPLSSKSWSPEPLSSADTTRPLAPKVGQVEQSVSH